MSRPPCTSISVLLRTDRAAGIAAIVATLARTGSARGAAAEFGLSLRHFRRLLAIEDIHTAVATVRRRHGGWPMGKPRKRAKQQPVDEHATLHDP